MADAQNRTWKDRFRHGFAVRASKPELTEQDQELIAKVASFVEGRGLTAPAITALESGRPYAFLGSQFLAFMRPFAHLVLPGEDYDRLTRLMENRDNIDVMLKALEDPEQGE